MTVNSVTTVYTAKRIITMDPSRPGAEAVAVLNGRIVAVGALDDVRASLGTTDHALDARFADSVLIAGLIDQHIPGSITAPRSCTSPTPPRNRWSASPVWGRSCRPTRTIPSASPTSTAGTAWGPSVPT